MKGELSENDLRYKAEAYCSSMERCVADVEAKLSQWGATPEMMEKIVRHLQDERYIDQKRFCSAFVRENLPGFAHEENPCGCYSQRIGGGR